MAGTHSKSRTLPVYIVGNEGFGTTVSNHRRQRRRPWTVLILGLLSFFVFGAHLHLSRSSPSQVVRVPPHAAQTLARCKNLKLKPGPPVDFQKRTGSDRFVVGTSPTLIKNATIWTGRANGFEVIKGDILLDRGLVKSLGRISESELSVYEDDYHVVDAEGAWVTPG